MSGAGGQIPALVLRTALLAPAYAFLRPVKRGGSGMDVKALLRELCDAAEQRDSARFASLFCRRGVYHDVFYGVFEGRARIASMIKDWFYKAASDLRWDMLDPVCDGRTL
jgi:SnoaL-like domain